MPWQRQSSGHVKLEITFDEPIVLPTELRPLLVTYDDADANVVSYCVEEVILEKLRAAPQTLANREKRIAGGRGNWLRPRSRDFYDRHAESPRARAWWRWRGCTMRCAW